jgi:hypothetical protein
MALAIGVTTVRKRRDSRTTDAVQRCAQVGSRRAPLEPRQRTDAISSPHGRRDGDRQRPPEIAAAQREAELVGKNADDRMRPAAEHDLPADGGRDSLPSLFVQKA